MLREKPLATRLRRAVQHWTWLLGTPAIIALALFAYRSLPARPFAADDFQWLIGARTLGFGAMLGQAFDPGQNHFYRPLVWLLFWLQAHAFGLDPRGYHAVSLGLHLANALLLGGLLGRIARTEEQGLRTEGLSLSPQSSVLSLLLAAAFVALHPAAFEAVTWVSAQSELLAAFWLLLALHSWLGGRRTVDGGRFGQIVPFLVYRLPSTVFLALALLTKESAVIGLPLLILLDVTVANKRQTTNDEQRAKSRFSRFAVRFSLPTLLTLAYLALQLRVERANYLVDQGGYGLGWQLIANPLRSLALIVAPLPETERANATWLVPVGAAVALLLVVWLIAAWKGKSALPLAALALTLLPTAPFVSPPDSRYLYLPVMAFAGVGAALVGWLRRRWTVDGGRWKTLPFTVQHSITIALTLALAGYFVQETAAREQRFAVATGADGSLMRVATMVCMARTPDRVILLNAPMAEQYARALLNLACGNAITPIFVDTLEVAVANLETNSLIIDFPNGTAQIIRQT